MKKKLNDLEIMRAINQARKMMVDKKPSDHEFLMSRWSTGTHTFVTAWGEFAPTLEDVALLTSLSMSGEAQVSNLDVSMGENKKRIEALASFLSKTEFNEQFYISILG